MNTITKEAGAKAGQAFDCASNSSSLTTEQRELIAKLASITEMIEGYKATIFMLERERMQLTTKLRLTGYRPPAPRDADG